jgi:hypothetical protein
MPEFYSLINDLNIRRIRDVDGPHNLADLGRSIIDFSNSKDAETYEIENIIDQKSNEEIVVWYRKSLVGNNHNFTLTRWSSNSFVLYDDMKPGVNIQGVIRGFLFGNDTAVHGLVKAMPQRNYSIIDEEKNFLELENLINSYQHHPSRNPLLTSTSETGAFIRIIKSLVRVP